MLLLIAIFFFGVLHGLGPDHLAAITIFGIQSGRQAHRVVFFAARFALGHALVIAIAGVLARFGKSLLPPLLEAKFDLAGGVLLIITGVFLVIATVTGKLRLHTHEHHHRAVEHKHWHLHLWRPRMHRHAHGRFAMLLGIFFALGGFRALLTFAPIALAPALGQSILRIFAFALGIVVSMVAYGLLSGTVLRKLEQENVFGVVLWRQFSNYAVGVFSILAGVLTLGEHVR